MKIAFLGLGTMGLPMAARLAESTHTIAGWDILQKARDQFSLCSSSPADCVDGSEVIISMLPNSNDVAELYNTVIFERASTGTLLIDCSTIDVETTKQIASIAVVKGMSMVDAPVSGGAEAASSGSLSFMVGGSDETFSKAKPVLELMGSKITHFGDSGSGQAAKACHNMICGITALGVCEAFALAQSLGLDTQRFYELCAGAAAQSWILENRCPVPGPAPNAPSSNNYAPGFAARLMAKDLGLAQMAAESTGQKTPFGAQAAQRFAEFAANETQGELDFSAIFTTIKRD